MPIAKDLKFTVLAPENYNEDIIHENTLAAFSPLVFDFIKDISDEILGNSFYKNYPQIMAMAFWMRRKNLLKMKRDYEEGQQNLRTARGFVFHITPSNVDTIFIYSWFLSMLMGNINILKVSRKKSEQLELILKIVKKVVAKREYKDIRDRFLIITYDNEAEVTSFFSANCDMRVIWGGDLTINAVRSIPLPPLSKEITFPDRFSYTLIAAEEFLSFENQEKLISDFLKDAYSFDQNACSSPRIIFWLGDKDKCSKARGLFWNKLEGLITDYNWQYIPSNVMDKFVLENSLAISGENIKIETESNLLNRILFERLEDIDREVHTGGGLFYEYICDNLNDLVSFVSPKDQTLSYFGLKREELVNFIKDKHLKGINRVVPVGKSLDFSISWDGYSLLDEFSKEIEIL